MVWLILKYSITVLFGAIIFIFLNHRSRFDKKLINPIMICISCLLLTINILTSFYHNDLASLGYKYDIIQMFLDGDNKVILNLLAGYILGFSLFSNKL